MTKQQMLKAIDKILNELDETAYTRHPEEEGKEYEKLTQAFQYASELKDVVKTIRPW